jgi:hypothetical protein
VQSGVTSERFQCFMDVAWAVFINDRVNYLVLRDLTRNLCGGIDQSFYSRVRN